MLAFGARLEAVREGFARILGLTGIQYTTLISVHHLESHGRVAINTIARHLHVSGAFVTIETGKLIRLGLLRKQIDPEDRRRVSLMVTPQGRKLLADLAPKQTQVNNVLFQWLTSPQLGAIAARIGGIVESADEALVLLDRFSSTSI